MRKIILFAVLFSILLSFSPVARADANIGDLSLLQMILEEVKLLQKRLTDPEAPYNAYKLLVISPNGSEDLKAGEYATITWDASQSSLSKINIYLVTSFDEGNKKDPGYVIARNVPTEMPFYRWLVPESLAGSDYKIFIRNSDRNYRLGDYSDTTFNILPSDKLATDITLNSPKGGEMYIAGRTYSIHWSIPKTSDRYIAFKLISGAEDDSSVNYLNANLDDYALASQGSHEWSIPESIPSGDYKFKIFGLPNLSCNLYESSNVYVSGLFKIVQDEDFPTKIILLSPPPVAEIMAGQPQTISWISPYDSDRVDILLRGLPSGKIYPIKYGVESGRPIDDNKIQWIPKSSYDTKDEKFIIKVCSSGSGKCGESEIPFSIISNETTIENNELSSVVEPPDIPEYQKLIDVVNSIQVIISEETPDSLDFTQDQVVEEIDYSSPKQSGYLPYNFDTRLSVGLTDSDAVRALQEALIREGLFNHSITGRFFSITEAAVKEFQTKYGLDPSGSVGPGTQRKLNELYSVITESID